MSYRRLADAKRAEEDGTLAALRKAELDANRSAAEATLEKTRSKSPWGSLGFWARDSPTAEQTSQLSTITTPSEKEVKREPPLS